MILCQTPDCPPYDPGNCQPKKDVLFLNAHSLPFCFKTIDWTIYFRVICILVLPSILIGKFHLL